MVIQIVAISRRKNLALLWACGKTAGAAGICGTACRAGAGYD